MPALPIYLLYNDGASGRPARPLHWDPSAEACRSASWWAFEPRARLGALLGGASLGGYGLRTVRALAQYAEFSGIARPISWPRGASPSQTA